MASSVTQCQRSMSDESQKERTSITTEAREEKKAIIIALGGAFNPIHTRHVMAMVEAKTWLEENTEYKVCAGRFAVAPDGYVKSKAKRHGYKCIKAEHRIKLCHLACREYSSWLQPYKNAIGSAEDCAKKTKTEFEKSNSHESFQIGVVIGADRAASGTRDPKWRKSTNHIYVCVGRRGDTERISSLYAKDKEKNQVNSEFYFVSKELDDVSSTRVRLRLDDINEEDSTEEKFKIVDSLVDVGWVCREEANYIVEHWTELYLK